MSTYHPAESQNKYYAVQHLKQGHMGPVQPLVVEADLLWYWAKYCVQQGDVVYVEPITAEERLKYIR